MHGAVEHHEPRRVEMSSEPIGFDQPFVRIVGHCLASLQFVAVPAIAVSCLRGPFLLSCERDADTAVELALFFDLGDHDLPDLARALHVRATARLQVDAAVLADDDEAYTARA